MDNRVFIIAELSANHNHSLEIAIETIHAAARAGVDAIKLQTYTADTITIDCDSELFNINHGTLWDGTTLYNLYKQASTPWEWHAKLFEVAHDEGLICFSSPFDRSSVDFLENLNTPIYKIASFEITDIPLVEYAASKGKPMIISTGIATLSEISEAVEACRRVGNDRITLLKCTSAYPANIEDANLSTIADMSSRFGVHVGLSDHTMGALTSIAAVAAGARVIEKHIIIDRNMGGADSAFSMQPDEFREMVSAIREVEKALGEVTYELTPQAAANRKFSRSLFVVEDIRCGEVFTENNLRSIRPAGGLEPKYLPVILGKRATRDLSKGSPLEPTMFE